LNRRIKQRDGVVGPKFGQNAQADGNGKKIRRRNVTRWP
jgi:hypothetical protein